MEIKDRDLIGAGIGLAIALIGYFTLPQKWHSLFLGLAILIGVMPILLRILNENKLNAEKEDLFLEFTRNLVESVKTGTPISRSIINMKDKNFGSLSPHVKKLANQISMGIPLNKALHYFSKDVNNRSISRFLTLIGQAEKAGGDIGEILEAVAGAVNMSDKLKKERKAAISTLVSQGYIIFLVFIVIILILQFQILPMVSGISDIGSSIGVGGGAPEVVDQTEISNAFLYLILTQGFFTGLVIGKLSEGNAKSGLKHSFGLMLLSFLASTIANIILSP